MTAPLRRVLLRRPATAGDWDAAGWRVPDPVGLERQHDAFCELLAGLGAQVEVAPAIGGLVDAVYMHDPLLMTPRGGIPLRMRKPVRAAEPGHAAEELERLGYRTNRAGAEALAALADPIAIETYDLPHDRGPAHVLHLQSFLSAVAEDLCVVFEPLAPVRLLEDLRERDIDWVAIDRESYDAMGCNVLAVRPGIAVMVAGAPRVRRELERRGVEVHVYDGSELSLKGDGGPTCLTAPLLRN